MSLHLSMHCHTDGTALTFFPCLLLWLPWLKLPAIIAEGDTWLKNKRGNSTLWYYLFFVEHAPRFVISMFHGPVVPSPVIFGCQSCSSHDSQEAINKIKRNGSVLRISVAVHVHMNALSNLPLAVNVRCAVERVPSEDSRRSTSAHFKNCMQLFYYICVVTFEWGT